MTDKELLEQLHDFNTGIIIVDNKGREFTIKSITETMGGQFHNVINLEEVEEPDKKWYRTAKIYTEQLEKEIELYESIEYKRKWIENTKSGKLEDLQKIVDNIKSQLEYVTTHYKKNDIID